MSAEAEFTMNARDKGLHGLWQQSLADMNAATNAMSKLSRRSQEAKGTTESFLGSAVGKYLSASFAVDKISDALRTAIDLQVALDAAQNKGATTRETATAKMVNQLVGGRESEAELFKMRDRLEESSVRFGQSHTKGIAFGEQLGTLGVPTEQIEAFIQEAQIFAAAAGTELGPEMMNALVSSVRTIDREFKDAVGVLRGITQSVQGLKPTQLTPEMMGAFAVENTGLNLAGLTPEEIFALNAHTLDYTSGNAARAATVDRALITHLQAPKPAAVKRLREMGLKPEEVDLIGEDIGTVMTRMGEGLSRLKPETRKPAMRDLFGEEYAGLIQGLVEGKDSYFAMLDMAKNGGGELQQNAQRFMQTQEFKQRQLQAVQELADARHGKAAAVTFGGAVQSDLANQNATGIQRHVGQRVYDVAEFIGRRTGWWDEQNAAGFARGASESVTLPGYLKTIFTGGLAFWNMGASGANAERSSNRLKNAVQDPASEQLQLLREIRDKLPAGPQDVRVVDDPAARSQGRSTPKGPPVRGLDSR